MADVSRRGFLAQMSVTTGVGIAGGLGLRQVLSARTPTAPAQAAPTSAAPAEAIPMPLNLDGVTLAGPMIVHVRDVANAEVALMVGPQELVYRDPDLVKRLVTTAATASKAEG